jgi:hypothetical protein
MSVSAAQPALQPLIDKFADDDHHRLKAGSDGEKEADGFLRQPVRAGERGICRRRVISGNRAICCVRAICCERPIACERIAGFNP